MTSTVISSIKFWLNAYLPPALWAGVIFVFSAQSSLHGSELSSVDFIMKKSAHMFVFGVLYLLFHRAFQLSLPAKKSSWSWTIPLIICFGYAISDEFHQSMVPGRYASSRDIGYDMLGAAIAWLKIYRYI
jgi:VanZ family protein